MKKLFTLLVISIMVISISCTNAFAEEEDYMVSCSASDEEEIMEIVNNVIAEVEQEYPSSQAPRWASGDQGETNTGTHGYIATRGAYTAANSTAKLGTFLTSTRKNQIAKGSVLPDKDEKTDAYAGHFYGANEKNYLGGDMTAYWNFNRHYNSAVSYYNSGSTATAMEYLGRALHYISDINEPHHATNKIAGLSRHTQFEAYVEARFTSFSLGSMAVSAMSAYTSRSTKTIADNSATKARNNITNAESTSTTNMSTAASAMMVNAQKDAAGVIYKFAKQVGII